MPKDLVTTPTIGSRGGVVGRPQKQPPIDAAQLILRAAAEGRPQAGVAIALGTSAVTLRRWMQEQPELAEAFAAGREQERNELHQLLMRDARDGEKPNINAMFLLKARHGYREGDVGEAGSRVNIIVNVPAPMNRDDYMKSVVSHD